MQVKGHPAKDGLKLALTAITGNRIISRATITIIVIQNVGMIRL